MRVLGPVASALAMLSAFATFVVLADLTPIAPTHKVVVTLLLTNALTVFLLLGIIGREVWMVVQARRRGRAAARLHVRIVALFAVIAAVPAILVALAILVMMPHQPRRELSTLTPWDCALNVTWAAPSSRLNRPTDALAQHNVAQLRHFPGNGTQA